MRGAIVDGKDPPMLRRKTPVIPDAVLDQLLADSDPKAAFDPQGLLDQPRRALNAEMEHHLASKAGAGDSRNSLCRSTSRATATPVSSRIWWPRDPQRAK